MVTRPAATYCRAHHIWNDEGQRTLPVISIRYLDKFVRQDGAWRFAERQLIIDWTDQRPSSPYLIRIGR
jgi:SnoaL-like domain